MVIAGPTASGKSALALALAERHRGTIINADAMQLYADLRLLTARPTPEDEARVPHRLYGVLDGNEAASAAAWAEMARAAIADTRADGRLPILVGGTGLYLRTLIDGIAPVPEIDPDIRAAVRALAPDAALAALRREDPAATVTDPQRVARALEVVRSTGQPLAHWQRQRCGGLGAAATGIVIDAERALLNSRAAARLEAMVADGVLAEVQALLARGLPPDRPILRALGVAEFGAVLAGQSSLAEGLAAAGLATRRYQKRQQTWARTQTGAWPKLNAGAPDAVLLVSNILTNLRNANF